MSQEFTQGDRVTVTEGYPGVVVDVATGIDFTDYYVELENDMGHGWWSENELTPASLTSTAAAVQAEVARSLAADSYPELGPLLEERPDYELALPEEEYQRLRLQGKVAGQRKEALYLPLNQDGKNSRGAAYQAGYSDGYQGAKQEHGDLAFSAQYLLGWADGLRDRNAPEPFDTTDNLVENEPALPEMAFDPVMASTEAEPMVTEGIGLGDVVDMVTGNPEPTDYWAGPGRNWSYDWCRFRRDSHCWLPKELNREATDLAGYAVWVPHDRGHCRRQSWESQQACPVPSQPGPNVPGGFTDATVPWEAGGQRDGYVDPRQRIAAKDETEDSDGFTFHYTAAWVDVQAKGKRIYDDGHVRVLSVIMQPDGIRPEVFVTQVQGENNVYQVEMDFVPGTFKVGAWSCTCPWNSYNWGRKVRPDWEGRACSHMMASLYAMQSQGMSGMPDIEDEVAPDWVPTVAHRQMSVVANVLLRNQQAMKGVQARLEEMGTRTGVRGRLRGQINGLVVDLEFDGGKTYYQGQEYTGEVQYPDYHPTRGLTASKKERTMPIPPDGDWLFTGGADTEAILRDEPEPALPTTTAEDDEPEVSLLTDSLSEPAQPVLPKTAGAWWGEHYEDDTDEVQHGVKCKTCEWCGGHNPEYISECKHCDRCTFCGEVQPTGATPRETYELREPHRTTHLYQAKQSSTTKTAAAFSAAEQDQIINEGEGTQARNLASLDLSGTHYQALDGLTEPDDDTIFW